MTKPDDSDEWWKQYGGEGVSSGPGASGTGEPSAETTHYPSTPPPAAEPHYPAPQQPPPTQYPPAGQQPYPSPQYPGAQYPNQQYPGAPAQYPQQSYNPTGYQPYGYPQQSTKTNGLAIASLVTSLAGSALCGVGAIIGIILGIVGLNQIKTTGEQGRGMALAGIWIGVFLLVAWIVYLVVVIVAAVNSSH